MDIEQKLDDIFTYVNNIKHKMDSLRDRMMRIEDRMDFINTNHSDVKKELEHIKFIDKNVGTHLGVEIEMPKATSDFTGGEIPTGDGASGATGDVGSTIDEILMV